MGSNEALPWIAFYALVIAALFPVIKLYRDTPLGIIFAAVTCFVFFVPVFLVAVIQRSSHKWPFRLLKWHLVACVGILAISVVTLFVHWLRGVGGSVP